LRELSGGMKRRVLIAKALSHEPHILFLDEPTAGVDVELRQDMWKMVRRLNDSGVTIILTTHYIEEAEEIADRVGIINNGELLLVDDKRSLMQKMGKKQLLIELRQSIAQLPPQLEGYDLEPSPDGSHLTYTYDIHGDRTGITSLLQDLHSAGLALKDLKSSQSSLEEIFVSLVKAQ
jgi:ABC-2 type transport system ATP-binding protein